MIHESTLQMKISQVECKPYAETTHLAIVMKLLEGAGNKSADHGADQSHLHDLCKYLFFLLQHSRKPALGFIQARLLLAFYEVGSGNARAASLSI